MSRITRSKDQSDPNSSEYNLINSAKNEEPHIKNEKDAKGKTGNPHIRSLRPKRACTGNGTGKVIVKKIKSSEEMNKKSENSGAENDLIERNIDQGAIEESDLDDQEPTKQLENELNSPKKLEHFETGTRRLQESFSGITGNQPEWIDLLQKSLIQEILNGKSKDYTVITKEFHMPSFKKLYFRGNDEGKMYETKLAICDGCFKVFADRGDHLKRHERECKELGEEQRRSQKSREEPSTFSNIITIDDEDDEIIFLNSNDAPIHSPNLVSANLDDPGSSNLPNSLGITEDSMSLRACLHLLKSVSQKINSPMLQKTQENYENKIQELEENGDKEVPMYMVKTGLDILLENLTSS